MVVKIAEIKIEDKTLELLDIVKQFAPQADYNDVILFLIGQYSVRLEELQLNKLDKNVILNEKEDGVSSE